MCNTYCFSTATIVARTRLSVTLNVHCLYCYTDTLQYYNWFWSGYYKKEWMTKHVILVSTLPIKPEPFRTKTWHRKHTPVDEDSELSFVVPLRQRSGIKAVPCRSVMCNILEAGYCKNFIAVGGLWRYYQYCKLYNRQTHPSWTHPWLYITVDHNPKQIVCSLFRWQRSKFCLFISITILLTFNHKTHIMGFN